MAFGDQRDSAGGSAQAAADQSWKGVRKWALEQLERSYLEQALTRAEGNVNAVAEWMELTPRAVYQKPSAYGLDPALFRTR